MGAAGRICCERRNPVVAVSAFGTVSRSQVLFPVPRDRKRKKLQSEICKTALHRHIATQYGDYDAKSPELGVGFVGQRER